MLCHIIKFALIFSVFLSNGWALEYDEERSTRLVLICGASCAGKSTLSKALAKNLGDSWIVLDRDEWAENENSEEKVDQLLIENILQSVDKGLKVIVDTQSFHPLSHALAELQPFTIFLYTPLPKLIERDQLRQQYRQRSERRQRYARAFVLDTYVQLLTFEHEGNEHPLDCINPLDIEPDFAIFPIHEKTHQFLTQIMQAKEPLCVYPAAFYHKIIKGSSQPLNEAVHEISTSINNG
ncbi:MAG: hypothetical protein CK425_12730 [Parachlamydia sp.]|nr:MAG: hypothetical protein CK425_12730 [Parachlamydia sp.]